MSALDNLLRHFAGLDVHGTLPTQRPSLKNMRRPPPGVVTAKRLHVKRSFGGKLSPTRYTGSVAQTRSVRMDVVTPQDIAATLTCVTDRAGRALVELVVLPDWRADPRPLVEHTHKLVIEHAQKERWRPETYFRDNVIAMLMAAVQELQSETTCTTCLGHRSVLLPGSRAVCPACEGTGYNGWGRRRRWPALASAMSGDLSEKMYRTAWERPLSCVVVELQSLLDAAWYDIKRGWYDRS